MNTGSGSSPVPFGKEPEVTASDEMEPVDSELFIRKAFTEDPEKDVSCCSVHTITTCAAPRSVWCIPSRLPRMSSGRYF